MRLKLPLASATLAVFFITIAVCDTVSAQGGRGPWWADRQDTGQGRGWQGGPGRAGGPGGGRGPQYRGGRQDEQFVQDRDTFHHLLASHEQIRRKVKMREDGVVTITESDDPQVAAKIQEHVQAMHARIKENRPIHRRDPLFDTLFRYTDRIEMKIEKTDKGVKVVETSDDPYVVELIQAHAKVVSRFVKNGFDEAHRNHEVPSR